MRKVDLLKKIKENKNIEHVIFTPQRYLLSCPYQFTRGMATDQVSIFYRFFTIFPQIIFRHVEYDVGFTLSSSERLKVTESILKEL